MRHKGFRVRLHSLLIAVAVIAVILGAYLKGRQDGRAARRNYAVVFPMRGGEVKLIEYNYDANDPASVAEYKSFSKRWRQEAGGGVSRPR
jgi:hypothetical protein